MSKLAKNPVSFYAETFGQKPQATPPKQVPFAQRTAIAADTKKSKNKYGAKAVVVDGIRFDSMSEAKRYKQLELLSRVGEISELALQVKIPLLPAQEVDGTKEKPVDYYCDFAYRDKSGKMIYEDVKSGPTKTPEFILKRKMVLYFHGIVVTEVLMN